MSSPNTIEQILQPAPASQWLKSLGVEDTDRGYQCLRSIRESGVDDEMLGVFCNQLSKNLPQTADPDGALANLERYINACRSAGGVIALFERDSEAMETLLQIFSTSQYLADQLVRAPDLFDLVRINEGEPIARQTLIDILREDLKAAHDENSAVHALFKFKQREMLRIAYADFIREAPLERIVEQLSFLADAILQGAIDFAQRMLKKKHGDPLQRDRSEGRFSILALGKLGGQEPDYSSDLNLMFLCDHVERTSGSRQITGAEYFDRLTQLVIKLLTQETENGAIYRITNLLQPKSNNEVDGKAHATDIQSAKKYFEFTGRTWQRQAFIKARAAAGSEDLGNEFLRSLQPWVYRRYLNRVDLAGIRQIKRRMQRRAASAGDQSRNVKSGPGGIDEIELLIQFLQLLNGSDLQPVRIGHTLKAITALEQVGCLTPQESTVLAENYKFLRSIEHHLQIMFDLATYTVPQDDRELKQFCWRMGFREASGENSVAAFLEKLTQCRNTNRKILDHLLHDVFGDDDVVPIETELILDPDPGIEEIEDALEAYRFEDPQRIYQLLLELALEKIPFLSARRCRHFLAVIAPQLLAAVAKTPDPTVTFNNMVRVSDSLGGKSALWELARFAPATLDMVVRLSAVGPYLTGILTKNPGMIDELMDSLILNRLPQHSEMDTMATELCRGAEDVARILFSFRNSVHLRVGVRDVLGKERIEDTHRALSDCAEVCVQTVAREQYENLANRFGDPSSREGGVSEFVILAVGKLGGQEPNYHSDLDLMFLYEREGFTRPRRGSRKEGTTNNHFFNQLAQRIAQVINRVSPQGRLYAVDTSLTPSGGSSILAVPIEQLSRYFEGGSGTVWERLSLCKARPIYGPAEVSNAAMAAARQVIADSSSIASLGQQVRKLRIETQQGASTENLKRGEGGTMDVELAVEMLQLKHAAQHAEILVPGTLAAIERLQKSKVLDKAEADKLSDGYRFLRRIESALRLMNTDARHDLPTDESQLSKLTYLMNDPELHPLQEKCSQVRQGIRSIFNALCDRC